MSATREDLEKRIAARQKELNKELKKPKQKQNKDLIKEIRAAISKLQKSLDKLSPQADTPRVEKEEDNPSEDNPSPVVTPTPAPQPDTVAPNPIPANPTTGAATKKDLQAALLSSKDVLVAGGTYPGKYESNMNGTKASPLTVRPMPGAKVTFDIASSATQMYFMMRGQYYNFVDINFINSTKERNDVYGTFTPDERPHGSHNIYIKGRNIGLINCVIMYATHCGIAAHEDAINSYIYGCLIGRNGISRMEHGIYTNGSNDEVMTIENCLIFENASNGITLHKAGKHTDNRELEGYEITNNILWNNATHYENSANINVGPANKPSRVNISNNIFFQNLTNRENVKIIYAEVVPGFVTSNNVYSGGKMIRADKQLTAMGGFGKMTGNMAAVVKNRHRVGRAHIALLNLNNSQAMQVDVSTILTRGQRYKLFDVTNLDSTVATGNYGGGNISVPSKNIFSVLVLQAD
jgi:hypothetical protein